MTMNPLSKRILTLVCLLYLWPLINLSAQSDSRGMLYGNNREAGNYIEVKGARIYFETYGQGIPLVLIHGNGGNIAYMKPQIDYFSSIYKVIIMDCRGRGKSELGNDSLTYLQMSEDIISIMDHLNLDSVHVVGRSDGGIIALLLAINHPDRVIKAVAFAANLTPDTTALYPFFYNQVIADRKKADQMIATNDKTADWRVIQQRNRLMEFQPMITMEDLDKIKCPVLVMSTDRDIVKEEHTLSIYRNIPNANLSILPGEDHYVTANNPELFNTAVARFLAEPFKGNSVRQ